MTRDAEKQANEQEQGIREIPTWARRYAENRTLPIAVNLVIFLVGFLGIGGLSYLTGWAYVSGHRPLAAVSMLFLAAILVFWLWYSLVGGAAITRRITERLYRGEGQVSTGVPPEMVGREGWTRFPLVGFLFMFCIVAHVGLGFMGYTRIEHMQPISALYVVPFIVYLGTKMRSVGVGSPFMLLWPALYAVHAMLLLAGAPIRFGRELEMLNMLVPMMGYGLLSALAGHIYSRIALRRLKALAASPDAPAKREGGAR